MDTTDLTGRTVLVTGAGSGIGRSLSLLCARRGARLVVCDVDPERLAETEQAISTLARGVRGRGDVGRGATGGGAPGGGGPGDGALGDGVLARTVDVTDREAMRAFGEEVGEAVGAVDLLVNNAGVGMMGGFLDTTLDDWDWIVRTNLMGVVHGLHFFLAPMIQRRSGHVVNLASMAAYTPTPMMPAYTATKYAVLGLSESLRQELRAAGIGVTAVCPGIIDTSIISDARLRGVDDVAGVRQRINAYYRRRAYGPDRVALNILKSVARGRTIAPVSPEAWLGYTVKRLSPALASRLATITSLRVAR